MIIELLLYLFFFYPRVAYAKRMGIEEAMQRGLGMAAFESEASHSNSTVPSTRRGYLPTQVRQIAPWKPAQRTVSQRVSGICFLHGSISSPQNAPWLSLMSDTEPIGSKSLRDAGANAPFKTMFRDLKLGGYNLEVTQLTTHRLISIILLVTIADSISTLSGRCIRQKGVAKYVCCPTEANRFDRRHSSFSLGLHGQNWIESNTFCQDTVQELSGFSTDKNDYYRQAMRAKTLIQQAF